MRIRAALGLGVLLALAGCSSKEKADPAPAPADTPATKVAPPTDATAAEKSVAPPFNGAAVDRAAANKARSLNADGLKKHKAKDYGGAIADYGKALEADPGNVLARYNLSCAYNLAGKRALGLAELKELRHKDCRACSAQLLWAKEDSDWESGRADKRFVELTSGIEVKSPSKKQAAETIRRAFDKKKADSIASLIHPTYATKFKYTDGMCDEDCTSSSKTYGEAGFKAHMKKWTKISAEDDDQSFVTFGVGDSVGACSGKCCDYKIESVTHGTLWLSSVCFREKAGVLFISELEVTDESS